MPKIWPEYRDGCVVIPVITLVSVYSVYVLTLSRFGIKEYLAMEDIFATIPNDTILAAFIVGFIASFVLVSVPRYFVRYKTNRTEAYIEAVDEGTEVLDYKVHFNPLYAIWAVVASTLGTAAIIAALVVLSCKYNLSDWQIGAMIAFVAAPIASYVVDKYGVHDVADGTCSIKEKATQAAEAYAEFRAASAAASSEDPNADAIQDAIRNGDLNALLLAFASAQRRD